jgi:hypothetical protein
MALGDNPFSVDALSAVSIPTMTNRTFNMPMPLGHVSWMYERLIRSIADFEEKLDQDTEIGARLVTFGNKEVIHIEDVGYWGPDLIIFHGTNSEGKPLQLLQHQSQVNVLLVAVPKEGPKPRRIGFELVKKLDKKLDKKESE